MKTHILKYNLVSVFIFIFGGISSYFVGLFFENNERRNLSNRYEDSFYNFINKVRERFNTALIPSVVAKTLELYEISNNDFIDIATTSSLRSDIEISVYSLKVDSNERESFTDIYGVPIVDGHFDPIPDNHTDTMWPIIYEYFPNDFPISLVGLDLYGEPIRNNIDEMIASDSVVISNPVNFVDTGELGLLVLQPIHDENGIKGMLSRGLRSQLILNNVNLPEFAEQYSLDVSMYIRNGNDTTLFFTYNSPVGLEDFCETIIFSQIFDIIACIIHPDPKVSKTSIVIFIVGILTSLLISILFKVFTDVSVAHNDLRIKSKLAADISHEILTPMNGIVGISDILQSEDLSTVCKGHVRKIVSLTNILIDIINSVVYVSNIEFNSINFNNEPIIIKNVVQKSIESVLEKHPKEGLNVTMTTLANTPVNIEGDTTIISKMVSNIVSNSLKFTDKGFIRITIGPINNCIKHGIYIEVKDSGIGMTKEAQKKIFNTFTQVHTNRDSSGVGLGLPITKGLVKLVGGKLKCESALGYGTTIRIDLISNSSTEFSEFGHVYTFPTKDETVHSDREVLEEFIRSPISHLGVKPKILVVDDNEINRLVLCHMLKTMGVETKSCINGVEAINECKSEIFSVILMDIVMPEMDGISATKLIRSEKNKNNHTAIIFVSATFKPNFNKECSSVGGNDFLQKPVSRTVLCDTLLKYMDRNTIQE